MPKKPALNVIRGTSGDDTLTGTDLADHIRGMGGNDVIKGGLGDDLLEGGNGDDIFVGGEGADTMLGGRGRDLVDYSQEAGGAGIIVNLNGSQSNAGLASDTAIDTYGNTDILDNIQDVVGTAFNDVIYGGTHDNHLVGGDGDDELYGDAGNDVLDGGGGDDRFGGGPGADTIIGGEGFDRLGYQNAGSGIEVTFTGADSGTVIDGGGSTDTFEGVELVFGSTYDDTFFGAVGSSQTFIGLQGNDTFNGNGGDDGALQIMDFVDYSRDASFGATHGVIVNQSATDSVLLDDGVTLLAPDSALDSFGGTDYLPGVRGVIGTQFDDVFYGGGHGNEIRAGGGNDRVYGFDGNDRLFGGAGDDLLEGGEGSDRLDGGPGVDRLEGGNGVDRFVLDSPAQTGADLATPDTIADFTSGETLLVRASDYGLAAGSLSASDFAVAEDANLGHAQFYYNETTDTLYWDADGVSGDSVAIAYFENGATLSSSDFSVFV